MRGGIIGVVSNQDFADDIYEWMVNTGNIAAKYHAGGCVGLVQDTKRYDSYIKPESMSRSFVKEAANYGMVTTEQYGTVGGIIGNADMQTLVVSSSVNHGQVKANQTNNQSDYTYVGGIIGKLGLDASTSETSVVGNGRIEKCCNFDTLRCSAKDNAYIGGIVGCKEEGYAKDDFGPNKRKWWCVTDCYNAGVIDGKDDQKVGGIFGFADWNNEVRHCINIASVTRNGKKRNGMIGSTKTACYPTRHECYVLAGKAEADHCTKLSEDNMKSKDKLVGLDFNRIWMIDTFNNGYPHFGHDISDNNGANRFQFVYPDK